MRVATLKEIYNLARASYKDLWDAAKSQNRDVKIYLHWTAGGYYSTFDDYHINIDADGTYYISVEDFSTILSATYYRNTGSVAVTLDCCTGATDSDLGNYPPTVKQIEAMAKVTCVLADALDLTIDKQRVMTHGEAADNEDGLDLYYPDYNGYTNNMYGPKHSCERWDLEYLGTPESPSFNPYATDGSRGGDVLRGKANWYRAQKLSSNL